MSKHAQWLAAMQAQFKAQVRRGCTCRVCGVRSKAYKVILNKTYVAALVVLAKHARATGTKAGWFKVGQDELGKKAAHDLNHMKYSKLAHWGLIEKRTHGHNHKPRSGQWRITEQGWAFLRGELKVPLFVRELHTTVIARSKKRITVHVAAQRTFNFEQEVLG
jgi:hypothetical protein